MDPQLQGTAIYLASNVLITYAIFRSLRKEGEGDKLKVWHVAVGTLLATPVAMVCVSALALMGTCMGIGWVWKRTLGAELDPLPKPERSVDPDPYGPAPVDPFQPAPGEIDHNKLSGICGVPPLEKPLAGKELPHENYFNYTADITSLTDAQAELAKSREHHANVERRRAEALRDPRWISIDDALDMLRLRVSELDRLCKNGELRTDYGSGEKRINRKDVELLRDELAGKTAKHNPIAMGDPGPETMRQLNECHKAAKNKRHKFGV